MRLEPLGDEAFILRDGGSLPAYAVASWLNESGFPGLVEANAAYETVGLYVDPAEFIAESFVELVRRATADAAPARVHLIPVCYDLGDDLASCAAELGITGERLIELHTVVAYRCYAIGFCPGFPYLGYLPPELCGLPRLEQPRVRVPVGSVAITGNQTGIYPMVRPGGWRLIGRTPLQLVSVEDGYFPIRAGDEVQFERITSQEFERMEGQRL